MVASSSPRATDDVVFDLDEEVTTEQGAPVVDPSLAFDLDEDGSGDGPPPATTRSLADFGADVFGLDEEADIDLASGEQQDDTDTIARDVADTEAMTESAAEMDAEALAAAMLIQLDEGEDSTEDSSVRETEPAHEGDEGGFCEPPDDISADDLQDAQRDQEHTRLMGRYMTSRGVIP